MLRWPDRGTVLAGLSEWAARQKAEHGGLVRLGVFGSFARGDSGVGSDLDLVAVVGESDLPFERRAVEWDLLSLPLPADLLVYTEAEWDELMRSESRFAGVLRGETVWLVA